MNVYSEMGIRSILLVGDDPWMRETLLMYFPIRGCSLQLASSAKEALKMLSRNRYEMILCENQLPDMDGLSFLKRCATDQPRTVRFLVAAYPNHPAAEEIEMYGINDVIRKPFVVEQLETSLRNLFVKTRGRALTEEDLVR